MLQQATLVLEDKKLLEYVKCDHRLIGIERVCEKLPCSTAINDQLEENIGNGNDFFGSLLKLYRCPLPARVYKLYWENTGTYALANFDSRLVNEDNIDPAKK